MLRDGLLIDAAGSIPGGPTLALVGRAGGIIPAIVTALQELGIATEIVTTAFAIIFGSLALAFALSFGLGNRELAGEVTRTWYRRYKDERDSIERENRELDKAEGIATTEEYVRPTYGIRNTGPHDVVRPPE